MKNSLGIILIAAAAITIASGGNNPSTSRSTAPNTTRETKSTFPYNITAVDPDVNQQLLKDFTGPKAGFVQVGPSKYIFPQTFKKHAEGLYNLQSRPDDIWVASFPRSGTTLMQELVWLIANDFDYTTAQNKSLDERFPFYEFCVLIHDTIAGREDEDSKKFAEKLLKMIGGPGYEHISNIKTKRFIKTHLPFSLMPPSVMKKKAKVIYMARNPKDVIVSFYYFHRLHRTMRNSVDFKQFWDYFEKDLVNWSPYWSHIKEGYARRNEPNVLFLYYEDVTKDLPLAIQKVAKFIGKKTITEEQVQKLAEHLNIENFRKNTAVNQQNLSKTDNSFIRSGKSTLKGWPKEYTDEIISRVEMWIEKNLADTTLRFPQ
ncbi:sulfotransferase 1 family member D1-like [Contarinia nasturtii]|uniref:sulfotransferase 1 family member D1-like n=1 Tax=Contarinia nasturtii TaxID=265458 RepID=UPI0012D45836|nr:sulfotransferase 1 family member D1-like [Contarinia nasturtii]